MKKALSIGALAVVNFIPSVVVKAATAESPWLESDFGLPTGTTTGIVESIVTWGLGIFGSVGVIAFVISGILYLTAAGDAEQEKKAKKAMTMGIIGVVVGLSGFVAIKAIDAMLMGDGGSF